MLSSIVTIKCLCDTKQDIHVIVKVVNGDFNEVIGRSTKKGALPLGFNGPQFIWSNLKSLAGLTQERIDYAFTNLRWRLLYLNAQMNHFEFNFILKYFWSDPSSLLPLTIFYFTSYLWKSNKSNFWNVFVKKRRLLAKMSGVEKALAKDPNDFW
ncbi:reverse transcriptase [Gossypium australe]|uniref:Reverse transcriptase n=1 Tax=Gossypium australe TaxID=47621 RepID=A0A5B6WW43_9ROSI|nr:reverse transcriptase [Gossypium australe]